MKPPYRLLLLTFLASFAVISIERSVYFFTTHRMGFSDQANLWLALGFGLTYVAGSLLSHPLARRLGEKRLVAVAFVSQIVLGGLMGLFARPWWYFTAGPLLGFVIGLQWPVIESYVAAGRETRNQQRIIGLFNLAWAGAIPLNLAVTGPLIEWLGAGMFYVPAVLNLVTLVMLRPLPAGPPHIPEDHPHRPSPEERRRLGMLLASHRWLMLGSYAAMFVLAPLLPAVFERLAVGETIAPALSGLLDAIRIAGFAALWLLPGWHGRRWPIVVSLALLPVGFFAALYGTSLPMVLLGEVAFGLSMAVIYYGALYYAMAVKNAAVDAGGAHEALIGSGFALGPAAGLIGLALGPALGGAEYGTMGVIGLLLTVTMLAGAVPLLRVGPSRHD